MKLLIYMLKSNLQNSKSSYNLDEHSQISFNMFYLPLLLEQF